MGRAGHLPLRPRPRSREEIYSIDTPPPDGERLAAHRPRVLLHPDRLPGPLQADGRLRGLLPDGLGRQRPADRAPRPELLRRARRRLAALRRGLPAAAAGRRGQERQGRRPAADQPRELHRAVRHPHRRGREGLRGGLPDGSGSRSTGTSTTAPSTTARGRRRSRRSCATSRRGEAYQAEAPGLWDVTFQTAVAQAELEARDYPGAFHRVAFHGPAGSDAGRAHRDHPPRAAPGRAWPSSPTPTTSATPALFGTTVTSPLFGVEVPVLAHHLAEPDKGAGIAMCCTFGDLTDVQWWRELQLPTRSVIQPRRPDPARDARVDHLRAGPRAVRRARRQDDVLRARRGRRRRCASPATSTASRRPPSARRTSTRRATSRSRSSPRASGTSATAAATPTCATQLHRSAARSWPSTPRSCGPATRTGSAASTATG